MASSSNISSSPRGVLSLPQEPGLTRARRVVHCLTLSIVTLFILCGAVGLVTWLCLHPRLPAFRVQSLSVSSFNLSAAQLTAKYNLELTITNPNRKIDLSIDHFSLSVVYRGATLSKKVAGLSPYLQIIRSQDSGLELQMDTDRLDGKARKRIVGNLGGDWSNGVVTFKVKMTVGVKFRYGRWLSKQKVLSVVCKNLNVEFVSTDTGKLQEGSSKDCIVHFE